MGTVKLLKDLVNSKLKSVEQIDSREKKLNGYAEVCGGTEVTSEDDNEYTIPYDCFDIGEMELGPLLLNNSDVNYIKFKSEVAKQPRMKKALTLPTKTILRWLLAKIPDGEEQLIKRHLVIKSLSLSYHSSFWSTLDDLENEMIMLFCELKCEHTFELELSVKLKGVTYEIAGYNSGTAARKYEKDESLVIKHRTRFGWHLPFTRGRNVYLHMVARRQKGIEKNEKLSSREVFRLLIN